MRGYVQQATPGMITSKTVHHLSFIYLNSMPSGDVGKDAEVLADKAKVRQSTVTTPVARLPHEWQHYGVNCMCCPQEHKETLVHILYYYLGFLGEKDVVDSRGSAAHFATPTATWCSGDLHRSDAPLTPATRNTRMM